jgi:ubiquinone/menaquinone biosynthesis C-methylase UbiE
MDAVAPFDELAADYDRAFTGSSIGRTMRDATWRRMDLAFGAGDRVLELNCGTGEDAVHLARRGVHVVATDSSAEMVATARRKAQLAGLVDRVEVRRMCIEGLGGEFGEATFGGALSNFGGVNCLEDLPGFARELAHVLKPGAPALLCVMGPAVPWEWGWYLARGRPAKAWRRLRPGGTPWRGMTVRYPSIGALRRAFAPYFKQKRVSAIGALVPPSYAEDWATQHPRLLRTLDRWERRLEAVPPFPWLADHYLIELERVGGPTDHDREGAK